MHHEISSERLTVQINQLGIELSSIQSKKTGVEYIWQANPNVWGSSAPVLFPIIGALKNNSYTLGNMKFSMPKHGIIRGNPNLKVIETEAHQISFCLEATEETMTKYPFKFRFITRFLVADYKLTIHHRVENIDSQPIPFTLGAHPAFKCPIYVEDSYDDYELHFEHVETLDRHLIDIPTGLISHTKEQVLENEDRLTLSHELFQRDAIVFKHTKSKAVSLSHKKRGKQLTVHFPTFPHLGIWAKPDGDFICIEPWYGTADPIDHNGEFTQKEGMIMLPSGEHFQAFYTITIHE